MALIPDLDHHQYLIHYSLARRPSACLANFTKICSWGGLEISAQRKTDTRHEKTLALRQGWRIRHMVSWLRSLDLKARRFEAPIGDDEGEESGRNRPGDTGACSDEPNSAESSRCWSAVGPPSHPSSHPLPAHTHIKIVKNKPLRQILKC